MPGNLAELLQSFDAAPVLPEINALQSGMRKLSGGYIAEAEKQGLVGLKGHRSVGGMRASLYNAFPVKGCEALAQLMRDFEARYG